MNYYDIALLISASAAACTFFLSVWMDKLSPYHKEINTAFAISLLAVIFFSILPRKKRKAAPFMPEANNMERASIVLVKKILQCSDNEKLETCKKEVEWFQHIYQYYPDVSTEIRVLSDALINKEIDFILNGVTQ